MKVKERGYTLVELLVTLAISGIIFSVVGSAVYQLSSVSGYGNDLLSADHELQNTAHWFNLDGQSAFQAEAGASLVFYLPEDRSITYSLDGANFSRSEDDSEMILAQNISHVSYEVNDRLVTLDITSSPPGREQISEQRTYQVYLRPVAQ